MNKSRRFLVPAGIAILLTLLFSLHLVDSAQEGRAKDVEEALFIDASTRLGLARSYDPTVLRSRCVEINLGLLAGARPAAEGEQVSPRILVL
jgi:hypothetical protein